MGRARWWTGLLWSLTILLLAAPAMALDLDVGWHLGRPPGVITEPATNITENSAVLSGTLADLGGFSPVEVSFEWGSSPALGEETGSQLMEETGTFQAILSDLEPDKEYYFRAKAIGNGTGLGSALTFTTLAAAPSGDLFPYWLLLLLIAISAAVTAYLLLRRHLSKAPNRELRQRLSSALSKLQEDTENADLWLEVAEIYLALGDVRRAQSYGEKGLSLAPDRGKAQDLMSDIRASLAAERAEPEMAAEGLRVSSVEEVREQLRQERMPSETIVCPHCSTLLGAEATSCYGCGHEVEEKGETLEMRIREARARLEKDEKDPDALLTMAAYLVVNDQPEEALEILNRLTIQDENYPGVWWVKARVFDRLGKPKASEAAIKRAMQLAEEETE